MKAVLTKLVIAEALPYGLTNILPEGSEVEVLEGDKDAWIQVVVVKFPDADYEWLSDGRVLAVDWMVFEANVKVACDDCGAEHPMVRMHRLSCANDDGAPDIFICEPCNQPSARVLEEASAR